MKIEIRTINAVGLSEIAAFLAEFSNIKNPGAEQLAAFAQDAEFHLAAGNGPCIELPARNSISRVPVIFTISAAGVNTEFIDIEN